MFFLRKYHLLAFLIFISLCLGETYNFSISPNNSPRINSLHWKHSYTNAALDINGVEIDIINWRVAANSKESVQIELINPVWVFKGWNDENFTLPDIIKLSDPINFRHTPTVYIQVTPWRIMDNQIEVLTSGEIIISVELVDFPINYNHPYLLNNDGYEMKRASFGETEYLIITSSLFASAAQALADMHADSVEVDFRLNTEVIIVEDIATDISGLAIRDYIIGRINNDLYPNSFLLLFGDETTIPPIFYNNNFPSDDFYTTPSGSLFDICTANRDCSERSPLPFDFQRSC